jgi:hypothetical protein
MEQTYDVSMIVTHILVIRRVTRLRLTFEVDNTASCGTTCAAAKPFQKEVLVFVVAAASLCYTSVRVDRCCCGHDQ